MIKYLSPLLIGILLFSATTLHAEPRLRPSEWATPVISTVLENWHKVDDRLHRSAQPDELGMSELKQFGVKRVLNLRQFHDDEDEARDTGLRLLHLPINAAIIKDEDMVIALNFIAASEEPVLVHCWHGSDRTGTVVAMYRMVFQGWSKEAALDELINGGYGYHTIYGNIPNYINNVDIAKIRALINNAPFPTASGL